MSYEIGKWYRVPAVHGRIFDRMAWWPVMGPKHEDAEIIGFPAQHYHIDWRFVPKMAFRGVVVRSYRPDLSDSAAYAIVIHEARHDRKPEETMQQTLGTPALRRMKCVREFPTYPLKLLSGPRGWLPKLEAAYADCKLKPGMVCPHRGIPLADVPAVDGIVTCPGHGLRWNVATGELLSASVRAGE